MPSAIRALALGTIQNIANVVPFKHLHDLERHFVRHGKEFGAATADEYEELADTFMTDPLPDDVLECARKNGDRVRFHPKTETFGVLATAGYIATFMIVKPLPSSRQTSLQYFHSNCQ